MLVWSFPTQTPNTYKHILTHTLTQKYTIHHTYPSHSYAQCLTVKKRLPTSILRHKTIKDPHVTLLPDLPLQCCQMA